MKKALSLVTLAGVFAAVNAFASGYRIPEQSLNSVALSGAYVAAAAGADASYFNPANMSYQENRWLGNATATYVKLPSIRYYDRTSGARNGSSETEHFVLPQLHLVSPDMNNYRLGISVTYPAGLSKRWRQPFPAVSANEFTLKTVEVNPSGSYKFSDKLSMAVGLRFVYAEGEVKNDLSAVGQSVRQRLDGDTTEYGYNLALTLKPNDNLTFAATYRSKIDLDLEGDACFESTSPTPFECGVSVSAPIPAVLSVGAAYTFNNSNTTLELTYDKTYWDKFQELDFNYDAANAFTAIFEDPRPKNWSNVDAYRLGLTHKINHKWTMMTAYALDENPVPTENLGFELPDSDAQMYSFGLRYKWDEHTEVGAAYLYSQKEKRTVTNNVNGINGEFTNASAQLISFGLQYRF